MERRFDSNLILSKDLIIPSAGTHLYSFGLSLFEMGSKPRLNIYDPRLILIVNTIYVSRLIVSLLTDEENSYVFAMIGDYSYYHKMRIHFNIAMLFYTILGIISQLINFWYYNNNKRLSFLKPFDMMSGLVSPKSIGLTIESNIKELIKRSKFLMKLSYIVSITTLIVESLTSITSLAINYESIYEIVFLGIPWSLILGISIHFASNHLFFQVSYFYIICFYLKIKLKDFNNKIKLRIEKKTQVNNVFIKGMIKSFNSLYAEITDYNDNYWGTYLFWFFALFITLLNTCLYMWLFTETEFFIRLFFTYVNIVLFIIFFFVLNTACFLTFEAKKSYKLFNALSVNCTQTKVSICKKIKVNIFKIF
jgi:hypothetical protein